MRSILLGGLFAIAITGPGCTAGIIDGDDVTGDDSGTGDDGGDDGAPTPRASVDVGPATGTAELGTTTQLTITVTSHNGFGGAVTLAATGVPASWTTTIDPSPVTLSPDGTATATLAVTVPATGEAITAAIGVEATSTAGTAVAPTPASIAVTNQLTLRIAPGTGAGNGHGFPGTLTLNAGASLRIQNDDSIAHRIHADTIAGDGFPHEDDVMGPGAAYVVTPTAGEYRWYCHEHGEGTGVSTLTVE